MSIPSAEVAADFKDALQDLKVNSRPEISNLTIIAKENTEHAQAISRELENHIRTVSNLRLVQRHQTGHETADPWQSFGAKTNFDRLARSGNSQLSTCSIP
jgi:hypothetical protein